MDCVFCKIASKEITSRVIFETENSLAFLDAFPLAIGHTLVIPKSHYKKIQDMPSEINTDLFLAVQICSSRMRNKVDPQIFSFQIQYRQEQRKDQFVSQNIVLLFDRKE